MYTPKCSILLDARYFEYRAILTHLARIGPFSISCGKDHYQESVFILGVFMLGLYTKGTCI